MPRIPPLRLKHPWPADPDAGQSAQDSDARPSGWGQIEMGQSDSLPRQPRPIKRRLSPVDHPRASVNAPLPGRLKVPILPGRLKVPILPGRQDSLRPLAPP
jgi:hypothetical protein